MRACVLTLSLLLLAAAQARAQTPAPTDQAPAAPSPAVTGGSQFGMPAPQPQVASASAVLSSDGLAAAPESAPLPVKAAIWAANALQDKPYRWGGGHDRVHTSSCDRGCDCSGAVSYALGAAGLLRRPRDSSGFMRYGRSGRGRWITIYTNPKHAWVVIAGLRLDTNAAGDAGGRGPRWRANPAPARGYKVRHPAGL
jgi:hypothetical protein